MGRAGLEREMELWGRAESLPCGSACSLTAVSTTARERSHTVGGPVSCAESTGFRV
jgi:hypothetical protein